MLDIVYADRIIYEDHVKQSIPDLREVPRLRLLPIWPYADYIKYASESSLFLCPHYNQQAKGVIEPIFMGVPSIITKHNSIPQETHFTVPPWNHQLNFYAEIYEDWIPRFYDYIEKGKRDPEIDEHLKQIRNQVLERHSLEASKRSWAVIEGSLKSILASNPERHPRPCITVDDEFEIRCKFESDMQHFMEVLVQECRDVNATSILELGAGANNSSIAFLKYIADNPSCRFTSIDILDGPLYTLDRFVKMFGLEDRVELIRGNDLEVEWDRKIDVLFIDSDHNEGHVREVLDKYAQFVRLKIIMHDVMDHHGVWRAMSSFLQENPNRYKTSLYSHWPGLAILKVVQ